MDIKAAVARRAGEDVSIETIELQAADLKENELVVRVMACGICHTDLTVRDIPEDIELPFPFCPKPVVLGHEGAGIVERVGSGVANVKPGDRVLMSFHYDNECPSCCENMEPYCENYAPFNMFGTNPEGGHYHFDKAGQPLSMMHHQSSLATHVLATRENTYLIPDDLPFEYAAPIGCGLMTGAGGVVNLLKPKAGSTIVIFGCGAVGLAAIAAARREGCGTIIAVDLEAERLEIARVAGAMELIDASKGNAAELIMAAHPMGVDYVLEATGVPAVIEQAIAVLATRGECALFGATADPLAASSFQSNLLLFGKHVHGGLMGHSHPKETIDYVVDLIRTDELPMARMVTTFPFANVNEAIASTKTGVIKPVVLME